MIVDFPAPVAPTKANDFPAGTLKEIFSIMFTSESFSYLNDTFLNSISPRPFLSYSGY